jgi:hypothetical protein
MIGSNAFRTPGTWNLAGIGLVVLAVLGFIVLRATSNEEGATVTTSNLVEALVIPPIDAAAPTTTETATFALG